jgi:hypothetical protein
VHRKTSFLLISAFSAISANHFGLFDGAELLVLPALEDGRTLSFRRFRPFRRSFSPAPPPQAERQLGPWNRRGE